MYAEAGEVIQCPDCGTELKVTEDKQLKRVVLEDQDWGERAHDVEPELKMMNPKLKNQPKPKKKKTLRPISRKNDYRRLRQLKSLNKRNFI